MPVPTYDKTEINTTGKRRIYESEDGETWNLIPGTVGMTEPEEEVETQQRTNDSTTGYVHDIMLGMVNPGSATFSYMYQRSVYAYLQAIKLEASDAELRATAERWWKFERNDGSASVFKGYLVKNGGSDEGHGDEPSEIECEIACTTVATFTAGDGTPDPIDEESSGV